MELRIYVVDKGSEMGKPIDWETEIFYRGRPLSDFANAIREECAREFKAALSGIGDIRPDHVDAAIERIRALKDEKT